MLLTWIPFEAALSALGTPPRGRKNVRAQPRGQTLATIRVDSLKLLVYAHRWLGIAGGILMLSWFASGIVMIYHRMPELPLAERMARIAPLDASRVAIAPLEAAAAAGVEPGGFTLSMLGDRPIYRFGLRAVYADDGAPLETISQEDALALATAFAPEAVSSARHDVLLTAPDQWTLQTRGFPLHRIELGDAAETTVYVSARTGEVVMRSTRSERVWGYAGAVLHWLYFTPFRARSNLWAQSIIWLSVAGCLLTLSGLIWGLLRFSPGRKHRPSGSRRRRSPYAGLVRWHHYVGLVFGLFSFTWILSGGLSMDPWSWHPGTGPTSAQRDGASLGPLDLAGLSAADLRAAVTALREAAPPRELGVVRFRGDEYWIGYSPVTARPAEASRIATLLVAARSPSSSPFERFPDADVLDAAVDAMPDVGIREMTWLDAYDDYYYDRYGRASLPVLRVDYADDQETSLYLDPRRGAVVRKEERLTRLNRWLYHGLHSLDFPFLYERRPLWDIVMIVLSIGGVVLSATTISPGFRRVGKHLRRLSRR